MADLSQIIEGCIRPQSNNAVYNMVPQPTPETQAAATLMLLYNVNAIMDTYGGKSLLFEQQVARFIGKLVGIRRLGLLAAVEKLPYFTQ